MMFNCSEHLDGFMVDTKVNLGPVDLLLTSVEVYLFYWFYYPQD